MLYMLYKHAAMFTAEAEKGTHLRPGVFVGLHKTEGSRRELGTPVFFLEVIEDLG